MQQEIEIGINGDVTSDWFQAQTAEIFCSLCGKGCKNGDNVQRFPEYVGDFNEAINNSCCFCLNKNPWCG